MPSPADLSGLSYGLPFEAYCLAAGIGASGLKAYATLGDQEHEPTPAMKLGSLVHTLVLEPAEFDARYAVCDLNRNSNAYKEIAEGTSKILIKSAEFDAADLMRQSIAEHPEARGLLEGPREVSVFWNAAAGIKGKCRPDVLGAELVDLKKLVSIHPDKVRRAIADYRYDWSDAWYLEGLAANGTPRDRMLFLCVEKEPKHILGTSARRHGVGLFYINDDWRARAARKVHDVAKLYAYSLQSRDWPRHPLYPVELEAPTWI